MDPQQTPVVVLDMGEGSPGGGEGISLEVSGEEGVVKIEGHVPDQTQSASIHPLLGAGEVEGAGVVFVEVVEEEGKKADPGLGDDPTAEVEGASGGAEGGEVNQVEVGDDDGKVAGALASYFKMLDMVENQSVIYADVAVECPVCLTQLPPGEGIVLRDCLHIFCRECLINCVQFDDSSDVTVNCPYRDAVYACESSLQQREIKGIVPPELFEKYLARSVKLAENRNPDSFHCRTPECGGWCEFEKDQDVTVFTCPVCNRDNCLSCEAIHEGMDCEAYQRERAKSEPETDERAKISLEQIKGMIESGEALHCPFCNIVITKPEGCDGVTCTNCKTEICWATKGFRWGKDGKGDNSGGCQCKVGGVLCHPNCQNCH